MSTNPDYKMFLENFKKSKSNKKVLIGFDGFVDEIIAVVDKRINVNEYQRMNSIEQYVNRLQKLIGVSGNIEIHVTQKKLGGNAPIMGNALIEQSFDVIAMASLGKQAIHEVFQSFSENCKEVMSITEPGNTLAFEFNDGKIMMNQLAFFGEVNWENLVTLFGKERLTKTIIESDLIACVNWTMLPLMNSIYDGIYDTLKANKKRSAIFIDLADPMKRTDKDILEMLKLLTKLNEVSDVMLGLNKSEAGQIEQHLGLSISKDASAQLRASSILEKLQIHCVVIHETDGAAAATKDFSGYVLGPYTPTPKLTTGAGDNFNAGFCSGVMRCLSIQECLLSGVFTSGFYVRNAKSPSQEEVATFAESWAKENKVL